MSKTNDILPNRSPRARKLLVQILLATPIILILIWECGHRIVFGDFFFYGHHVDLVLRHEDPGTPGAATTTCMRVGNYTVFPLRLEGSLFSFDSPDEAEISFHFRLEKWDQPSRSWSTVFENPNDQKNPKPNKVVTVYPLQSRFAVGCYAVATMKGVHRGDTVRYVLFSRYRSEEAASSPHVIYSPSFVIDYDR